MNFIEHIIATLWNRSLGTPKPTGTPGVRLGHRILDSEVSRQSVVFPHANRPKHAGLLGKTGSGKSSLLRHLGAQDIRQRRGFINFDLHGDTTPYLLRLIAEEETRHNEDLSERLIIIEPADPEASVGINVLASREQQSRFVQIAEFTAILRQRWGLHSFGARTEEVLRNALMVLAENGLTLTELAPLLTEAAFRSVCLRKVQDAEVRSYFANRYNQASEAMQAVLRDAILNKVTTFTGDPRFRHIVGQRESTFDLTDAIDRGFWILLNLDKGRLGEQAATLGSLFLTQIKNALFSRRRRDLFSLYCDEIQNLLAYDSGLETLLSEARKFGIGVLTANQFFNQYPDSMRAAILAVGTHVLFQLSSTDADKMAQALNGGRALGELLKNLPPRHFVFKTGHHRWCHGVVPTLREPQADYSDLYNRCRSRWARRRTEIEADIQARHAQAAGGTEEVLDDWE